MKFLKFFMAISLLMLGACVDPIDHDEPEYVPTDVLVGIRGDYPINRVFDFINLFDHDVENIHGLTFRSALGSDSLQYVISSLNAKPYVINTSGYLSHYTQVITVFPALVTIKDTLHQQLWLENMEQYKLRQSLEDSSLGCTIYFHVPEGEEECWVDSFKTYDFVRWAQLNEYVTVSPCWEGK